MLSISSFPSCSSSAPRKRTMSFDSSASRLSPSIPRSASPLRRTGSYLSLTDLSGSNPQPVANTYITVRRFIENQERRFKQSHGVVITSHKPSSLTPPAAPRSPISDPHRQRTSSPLAPVPHILPPRPSFPRSKPEPDLYKMAIITRHRRSAHEGQTSHLSVSVFSAIKDPQGIVSGQQKDSDGDIIMEDPPTNNSWLVVSSEDLEMADC